MEALLRPIYQERASQPNTLGIILVEKRAEVSPSTDTFDSILFILTKEAEQPVFTKHYTFHDKKAALHIITEKQLRKWLTLGTNPKLVDWLINGRVVFDRNEFIEQLKKELDDFPVNGRKIRMGIEFSKLTRRYLEGKLFFEQLNYLDAYSHVVESLHHLARLAVLQNGMHPEVMVWKQVKQVDPSIYKLYDEIVSSEETLEKRLELLFLASEFLIHSRIKEGAQHIVEVLSTKEFWTIQEIHEQEELKNYSVDLEVFIEFLVERGLILIEKKHTKSNEIMHRYYKVER
ncbi:nucleotidyltransferase-like protein [Psychrobacillus insolitus]|uniref:Nucleotidyltransferase-like protein n=1 Tax=Psychrobacillus insolitus TaxID=1461 RepID=A0A2W7MJ01_9BACI|nr:nucleotidyltransferase-like protein [Psychrobacillus insolitus]PZX03049.1 nucleotidyltransferase-like protein [Psychrobacillus insolitus]